MTVPRSDLKVLFFPAVMLTCGLSTPLVAQDSFRQLSEHTWAWISSDPHSANGALLVGDDVAMVVDPGLTPSQARSFLAEARRTAGKPIRYALTTHWHPDHAFGLSCLPRDGMIWVAHPVVAERFERWGVAMRDRMADNARSAAERQELRDCTPGTPDSLISTRADFDLGSLVVSVWSPGPAHTEGDLVVWAPSEGTLVAGDLFLHQSSPSMSAGSPDTWVGALNEMIELRPQHVVAGHFGPSQPVDLVRFRDYMTTLVRGVRQGLARGVAPDSLTAAIDFGQFSDFAQFPEFRATLQDNVAYVAQVFAGDSDERPAIEFPVLAVLDVGQNPHQIAFSADGNMAYVAAAGSNKIAFVNAETFSVEGFLNVPGTPLGVVALPSGDLAVTRFQDVEIARYSTDGDLLGRLATGGGPSLFSTPLPGRQYLVSVEQTDQLWIFNADTFELDSYFSTGDRPFPPAATSDGRLAFVPGYNDGTVTVIDLNNREVLNTIQVGTTPSGGAVLPGDREYAVAVRGDDRIALIDTETLSVTGWITDGIGDSPFSVVVSVDGRFAFVNNTASHDISVIALPQKAVIARIQVGEIPIVMAVHPDGRTLWVSSEGSHELTILGIPR